jgi:uncharacterized membrane protein
MTLLARNKQEAIAMPYLVSTLTTAVLFALLDNLWFRWSLPNLYRPEIGELLGSFRLGPAVAFYVLYVIGIQIFAVRPALASGQWSTGLIWGALFGFFCYMTWNLTNYAVMKTWSLKVTLTDITWGTVATAVTAGVASALALRFAPAG